MSFDGYKAVLTSGEWKISLSPPYTSPLEMVLQEIEGALKARLYYLAVVMSVALPDICAALESADGETSGKKYRAWYNANLAARLQNLTDVDCYSLRCGVVHQGRYGHDKMQYGRVVFLPPTAGSNVFMDCVAMDAYFCSVVEFCRTIVDAVRIWFVQHQHDPSVQANLPRLVQLRPTGFPPYVVGTPVIA